MASKDGAQRSLDAGPIIESYRTFIEALSLAPTEIRDESELPYPKQKIEDALMDAYALSGGHHYAPANIQSWLLLLAQFHSGVGEPIRDPAAETARRMTRFREEGNDTPPEEISKQVAKEGSRQDWMVRRMQFQSKVDRDRSRLLNLLRQ